MHIKRLIVSFFIALVITGIIFVTLNDFGIVWDEPIHMRNAIQYVAWLKNPVFSDKDKFFQVGEDDVHPPLRKIVAGLTHELLTNDWKMIDNTRGFRISSLLYVFPFIFALTYISIGTLGYAIGILVPLMLTFLPHVLFLTPLLTMDYAIMALWFVAVVAGMKGIKNYFWLVISAVTVGVTMLTKLHGFLLFLPTGGYWFWHTYTHKFPKRAYISAIIFLAIAGAVYIGGWPWLWTSTIQHLGEYFHIQFIHGSVPEYVLGHFYTFAPWWYTPLMFLITTPALILIAFFIGAYWSVRYGRVFDKVLLLNALFPIIFFSLPGVYRYDWVRLFLPAFPFVCLVAGKGIWVICSKASSKRRSLLIIIVYVFWLTTVYSSVVRIYPWVSSYYNEFVGGPKGAATLGFESEYYGNAYIGVLPWMNDHKNDMMCVPFTKHAVDYYQAMGQIQAGVVFGATGDACRYEIILMRQGFILQDPYITKLVNSREPVYSVSLDGVPLVGVFDRTGMLE